jgi:hypothetical protein
LPTKLIVFCTREEKKRKPYPVVAFPPTKRGVGRDPRRGTSPERRAIYTHDQGPLVQTSGDLQKLEIDGVCSDSKAPSAIGTATTCEPTQQTKLILIIVDMKQARYPARLVLVLAFCFACVPGQFVEDVFGAEDIYSPDEVAPQILPRCELPSS